MLGITVSDATLIGTLVLAFLAFFAGDKSGAKAASEKGPTPDLSISGMAIVDSLGLRDNTAALNRLAMAIERATDVYSQASKDELLAAAIEALRATGR